MERKISVIGLGYVGLPVAVAFSRLTKVIGFDIHKPRLEELRDGNDSTYEVANLDLKKANIFFTSNPEDLSVADFHIVAVPTPIDFTNKPDLSLLINATETVGKIIKPKDIVVYESTVFPGCTEEECIPILEKISGMSCNSDFGVGYSPERINPGDKDHNFTNINKIVSGSSKEVAKIIGETYESVVTAEIYMASSIKVAEAAKVIENTQRDLNIAFINELAMIFNYLGIETQEVLEAASTKWNFLPFSPGLVGGHCIGVDPYYLAYRAEKMEYHPKVILAGRSINDGMGSYIAQKIINTLNDKGISPSGAKITVLGLTFKENCPDLRNSQVPGILTELTNFGCDLQVYDPVCDRKRAEDEHGVSLLDFKDLLRSHVVLLAVAHQQFCEWPPKRWYSLLNEGGIVIDVKNVAPRKMLEDSGYLVWRL